MKIATIIGARPQFIKAATVSRLLAAGASGERHREVLVHTGQHYDPGMSGDFFVELDLPAPAYELGVGSLMHGAQTARMLEAIEPILLAEQPQCVLVYGDTNSTLAGALAAVKIGVPVAHVEAGLRSFDSRMPEEINRVLVDRISARLFCPSELAVANLAREGIVDGVEQVGDVMVDALLHYGARAGAESDILDRLGLRPRGYAIATLHRARNTDDRRRLAAVVAGLERLATEIDVVLCAHPRTRRALAEQGLEPRSPRLTVIEPVSYLDMIALERHARCVCTDSGGMQKEAYLLGVPCLTLREETEWPETVEAGWNRLVGCDPDALSEAFGSLRSPASARPGVYGDGHAAERIVDSLVRSFG